MRDIRPGVHYLREQDEGKKGGTWARPGMMHQQRAKEKQQQRQRQTTLNNDNDPLNPPFFSLVLYFLPYVFFVRILFALLFFSTCRLFVENVNKKRK